MGVLGCSILELAGTPWGSGVELLRLLPIPGACMAGAFVEVRWKDIPLCHVGTFEEWERRFVRVIRHCSPSSTLPGRVGGASRTRSSPSSWGSLG